MTTLLQTEFAILVLAICFRFFMRIQIKPRPGIQGHHGDGDEACPANNEHDGERDLQLKKTKLLLIPSRRWRTTSCST